MSKITNYNEEDLDPFTNLTLADDIENETEYLESSDGETIECISVENILVILKRHNIDVTKKRS